MALRDANGPVVGVADAPASGLRLHAARGEGAWESERRLAVSPVSRLDHAFVLHASLEEYAARGETAALEGSYAAIATPTKPIAAAATG